MNISKDKKFLRFQKADMRIICNRILEDIKFMATHNLMDYSLLLITEKNPDFIDDNSNSWEKDCFKSAEPDRLATLKVDNSAPMLFKKQPSGILEVEEEDEDEGSEEQPHLELANKLDNYDPKKLLLFDSDLKRQATESVPKSSRHNLFNSERKQTMSQTCISK